MAILPNYFRVNLKRSERRRVFTLAATPLKKGDADFRRHLRKQQTSKKDTKTRVRIPRVNVLFLSSPSSDELLAQWSYFHLSSQGEKEEEDSEDGLVEVPGIQLNKNSLKHQEEERKKEGKEEKEEETEEENEEKEKKEKYEEMDEEKKEEKKQKNGRARVRIKKI